MIKVLGKSALTTESKTPKIQLLKYMIKRQKTYLLYTEIILVTISKSVLSIFHLGL